MKPIIAYNDKEEILYPGIREAANRVDRKVDRVRSALKTGGKCAGYKWKYA
jgi:hypothetical protein